MEPSVSLDDILRARGLWPGGRIRSVRERGDDVRIRGAATRTMSRASFRSALNGEAPCLFPERYPAPDGAQGGGRLPLTVPSSTFDLSQEDGAAILRGRGWGHDVGMSQWGAKALADAGWDAQRILRYYYNDVSIGRFDVPDEIRVKAAEGLRRIAVRIEGRARVETDTGSRIDATDGLRITRDGEILAVERGAGARLDPITSVSAADPEGEDIVFTISRSARVRVLLRGADGTIVHRSARASFMAGDHRIAIPAGSVPPGSYEAIVEADDGLDRIRAAPVAFVVAAESGDPLAGGPPSGDPDGAGDGRTLPVALAALAALLAAGAWGWARLSRR